MSTDRRLAGKAVCIAAAVLLFLAAAAPLLGQKTDVLELENGDRITGEIKSYASGRLTVDTSASGFITVKWNKILSITSDKIFDVETIYGSHIFGAIGPSVPPGGLLVLSDEKPVELKFFEVFNLSPVYQSFWRRWEGSFDLGFNYTQSSQLTQLDVNAQATYRVRTYQLVTDLSTFFSRQQGVTAADRVSFTERFDRFVGKRWIVSAGVGLDRNIQLGLKRRVSAALGGGYNFVQTNQTTLTGFAALSGNNEQPVAGEGKYNAEALVGGRYRYFMYDFPKLNLNASVAVYPSLTTAGRVRLEASGSARREIVSDFYIALSIFDSFDSRDPTTGASRNDWGPTISVGWQF